MTRKAIRAALLLVAGAAAAPARALEHFLPPQPDQVYGALFADVQRAHVFPDEKTFPDCVPREDPAAIVAAYDAARREPGGVDLGRFVREHFIVPAPPPAQAAASASLDGHLSALWGTLTREALRAPPGSSLLPLPRPYVVPGGRFRELYYWDSYFTMLGLRECGRGDLIRSMIDDFASELSSYGLVPNGNRTYFLSRSQPPFLSLMVELEAGVEGGRVYAERANALADERAFWTRAGHAVRMPDGGILERYRDALDTPRDEAFATDEALSRSSPEDPGVLYANIRAAAESGWDFSSRWMADGRHMATIDTTDIVPVDLNCLLVHLERTLARAWREAGDARGALAMAAAADRRAGEIQRFLWSGRDGFFFDYNLRTRSRSQAMTLAGVAPLFLGLATREQADAVASTLRSRFLRPGGAVTTLAATGQQWDAPNGWAPLEWMTVQGLRNYGHEDLAGEIARRWMRLNREVYRRTGRMMEKYNVEDTSLTAGGGEYPSQDGFGWTNGVFLALRAEYREGAPEAPAPGPAGKPVSACAQAR